MTPADVASSIVTNILLVDDQPANLMALEAVLEPLGQRLVRATSGQKALEYVHQEEFAVVLLDVRMPVLDGFQTAARMRKDPRTRHVPIIFVTADWAADEREAYAHGGVDVIRKPYEPAVLKAKVQIFIELARRGEQLKRQAAELAIRASSARSAVIIESLIEGICIQDQDGVIQTVNASAERILGLARDELIGRTSFDPGGRLVREDGTELPRDEHPAALALRTGVPQRGVILGVYRRDGELVWLFVNSLRLFHPDTGSSLGVVSSFSDITRRKHIEEERLALLERAERAQHAAEEANQTKDRFLATVSHELRTPLNAILGWTSILRADQVPTEQQARALEAIERNAKVQVQLVDELLDIARIATGKMRLDMRSIELAQIVDMALDTVRPAAESKQIRIQRVLAAAFPLVGDPDRLQQVVWNLLANAIKFTPRGGWVRVQLAQLDSQLELTVTDSGKGISPDFLPYVFEKFRQAAGSDAPEHGGLGLGLAIVKYLVELHGGTVEAQSKGEGHGATFVVRLPVTTAADRPDSEPEPAAAEPVLMLDGIRVLVVDDEPELRELLVEALGHYQAQVRAVASAAEALKAVHEFRPEVIVSDIGMPGEDGYSLIRRVRSLAPDEGGQTPALALTAFARAEDRARVLRSGFQMYLAKPVELAVLLRMIGELVGRKSATQ